MRYAILTMCTTAVFVIILGSSFTAMPVHASRPGGCHMLEGRVPVLTEEEERWCVPEEEGRLEKVILGNVEYRLDWIDL